MAVSYKDYTSTTSKIKDFTFPYIKQSDIKVRKTTSAGVETELVEGTATGANPGQYTWTNATRITLNDAPVSADTIRVYRDTASDELVGTFFPGSAIRAADLNDNFTQNLYVTQEAEDAVVEATASADAAVVTSDAAKATADSAATNATTALNNSRITTGGTPAGPSGGYTSAIYLADQADGKADDAVSTANGISGTANAALPKAGGTMTGAIAMGTNKITGLGDPTADQDAVTKAYLVTNNYTKTEADSRYYNLASTEEIQSGETWVAADDKVATTSAIDNRIVDLVDEVGGFVPLASEANFPATNPDVNNGAGTIVSIGVLGASYTPSTGTCTIPDSTLSNISGSDVTITDCGTTVLSAGYGCLVETTTTLHQYKFHRLTPKATEVTTVAGKSTEIGRLGTAAAAEDLSLLGTTDVVADMNLLADSAVIADMAIIADTTDLVADIGKVADIQANVTTVAGIQANVTTVAGVSSDVTTVADNITDVSNFADLYQIKDSAPVQDGGGNTLAAGDLWFDSSENKTLKVHNGTAFTSISPTQSVLDDISIVSGNLTRVEDLGSIADAITSGSGTGSLDTCANNITNINTFANTYFIASEAPTGGTIGAGDLWYDTTGNVLKYYNGSIWTVTAAAGLSELSEDTSPELANHLECNDKNITEVATISGDNLQIDFGSLT